MKECDTHLETITPDINNNPPHTLVQATSSVITFRNHWDHVLARLGIKRNGHLVDPGLYALGTPDGDAPVFVTANYTLSFDALRAALAGIDCYIMVLDTRGINVWCAAGKGTFGTDELVHRIEVTRLKEVTSHRVLILPQMGAPGVAAHEVKKRSGFKVEYGPVRADDLPEYLKKHKATSQTRRVRFTLRDRLVLIPLEFVHILLPLFLIAGLIFFFGGFLSSAAVITSILAGVVLFPILLPWLPTKDFSTKGFILGVLVIMPFALAILLGNMNAFWWLKTILVLIYLLTFPSVTAFIALNFTGSTTFTSRSGVRREIFTYIPLMAWTFGIGISLIIAFLLIRKLGGI